MKLTRTKLASGERYSVLLDEKGVPAWYPTLFATSQLINKAAAPNTIEAYLNAIRLLLEWCNSSGIVLEELFSSNRFLAAEQVEQLCIYLREKKSTKKSGLVRNINTKTSFNKAAAIKARPSVTSNTLYIRASYVAKYVDWLAKQVLSERGRIIDKDIAHSIRQMVKSIEARRPIRATSYRNPKKGLTDSQRSALISAINSNPEHSPFSPKTIQRDKLIFEVFFKTGVRLGELMSIKISDLDFQKNTLHIPRRHDDIADPRLKQPVVKTLDRLFPLDRALSEKLHDYILNDRAKVDGANKHEFLFVTYKAGPFCGAPLSSAAVYKVVNRLRTNVAELSGLTPHSLRHTWNDMFSEKMDELKVPEAEEEKIRSRLMGWAEGSGTSAIYTQRHIDRKANEASLLLQRGLSDEFKKSK